MFIAFVESRDGNNFVGKGSTLKNAHISLKDAVLRKGDQIDEDDDIEFFEATRIEVEFTITRKQVVTSLPVATTPKAAPRRGSRGWPGATGLSHL